MLQWENDKSVVTAVGLMSGTSLDGVDAAIVRIEGSGLESQVRLLHFYSKAYDDALRGTLKELCDPQRSNVQLVCGLNAYLGELFADAALKAVEEAGMRMEEIDFISSHGQTAWHMPDAVPGVPHLPSSTLQLGDLSVIAKRTGVIAIGDFRPADMAVGGQGAPLVPYGDLVLFRHPEKGRLLQNIGGIGNCTVLPPNASMHQLLAFDTGPGNMVIDSLVHALSDGRLHYDESGKWAAEGTADEALLQELMTHPYFRLPPPKSTGREMFGAEYAVALLERVSHLPPADIIATATAFTAHTIADACRKLVMPRCQIDEVIVSGGGAHNKTLLSLLQSLLPEVNVTTASALGVNDDAKEAIIFALLGHACLLGHNNNVPTATGAGRPTVMGKLALP
ncbi:anhydro-N-acetylmuramic acid kinase [Paenibacillus sp. J5C_2022]|uniref:anhydro-N-acetylmuramic acid kinase n=1 Tax=Paenibacillus sp. J5C2022 TaxID=2977129 RepID=UPI0021D04891|nr:anhydro-N-acetylmuramic acid kinase [Paenibacillus sp. J5C2022]MCU6708617.1 anhydro-N-acetylmuramic acid kinase [Paenibacillus sp. J5C2022]